jgi:hypothetical protein
VRPEGEGEDKLASLQDLLHPYSAPWFHGCGSVHFGSQNSLAELFSICLLYRTHLRFDALSLVKAILHLLAIVDNSLGLTWIVDVDVEKKSC